MTGVFAAIARSMRLLEDAIALLRTGGLTALAMYLVGTLPLAMSLLATWGLFARTRASTSELAGMSLAISVSLVWAKCWQNRFAAVLIEELGDRDDEPWTFTRRVRLVGTQALAAAITTPLLLIAFLLVLPMIWIYPFCQHLTILLDGRRGLREAWNEAWSRSRRRAASNAGWVLVVVPMVAWVVLVNLAVIGQLLPLLLEGLLAVDTPLSRWAGWASSPTWLGISLVLTWLAIDMTIKAAMATHTFRDQARTSGVDLLAQVRRLAARSTILLAAIALLVMSSPLLAQAAGPIERPPSVQPTQLDGAIDQVLRQQKYNWRQQRSGSPDRTFLDAISEWIDKQIDAFWEWLESLFERDKEMTEPIQQDGRSEPSGLSDTVQWVTIGLVAIAIGAVAWVVVKRMRDKPVQPASAGVVAVVADEPDVSDESVTADALPEDDWLAMARRLEEEGKPRLALRALFLSDLAYLGRRDLLRPAKHKSNRDYLRELARRSLHEPTRVDAMERNTRLFERCWYGRHEATGALLAEFRQGQREVRSA
ncbi:MAG: DUF4129 domain-containing protein [Phycisphaerae bacterium]